MSADRARVLELLAQCRADLEAMDRAVAEVALLRSQAAEGGEGLMDGISRLEEG